MPSAFLSPLSTSSFPNPQIPRPPNRRSSPENSKPTLMMDGFSRHHQQQQQSSGGFWHPSSSSPPPPPGGYHPPQPPPPHHMQTPTLLHHPYHHQQSYASQLPNAPPPQHQLWFHPPQQPVGMSSPAAPIQHYPPPYHNQSGIPPPYHQPQHRYPPPHPQPHPMAPPPTSAYPPPGQAWGNPSWQQHQLWEYPDRIIPYNNEEDWAAKARAWAATDSMPETHHARSQFSQLGRVDEPEYAYRDHFPKVVPPIDNQLPPLAQSNGRTLYDDGETGARETSHLTPTPRSYYPTPSVYEQEVPYTYSSSQVNREAIDYRERPQESLHSQFRAPVQLSSVEEPHFMPGPKPSSDICDQPLDFQPRPTFGPDQLKQFSYSHVDRPANDGIMDQNIVTTSVHAWTSTTTPAVTFPPIPLAPSGVQFDPSFASQPSLSVYTAPAFGGISIPNFQAPISPVSTPFGLGVGTALHATNFLGDGNVSLSLSERPKKAAVPNWLREEIIKKKSAIASTNSLHSGVVETEDADMSFRRSDQTDDKSLDSRRSIEDEDDDEDEVEAARSAAINQEIKRILTEVLLKVTDELFDEIATKVLDEDEPNAEVVESIILDKPRISSPPFVPTPKESTKILVPQRTDSKEIDANELSRPSTASGDLLGLGNYDSDASNSDNDNENGGTPSRKLDSTSHRPETDAIPYEHSLQNLKTVKEQPNADSNGDVQKEKKLFLPDSRERIKDVHVHAKSLGASETSLKISSIKFETAGESRGDDVKGLKSNEAANNERVKRPEIANSDRAITDECGDDEAIILSSSDHMLERSLNTRVAIKEVAGGSHRNDSESNKHREKQKEKIDKGGRLNERISDGNVKQGTHERETHSKSSSRSDIIKDSRKDISKDKTEKQKGYIRRSDRERDQTEDYKRDEKDDRSKFAKETFRRKIRSKSPISIGRHVKDNSAGSRASASSEDSFDNPRKRKLQSRGSSLSTSPRSTKRQVSRSPPSKHSHSRHSPYSTARRNRRSRSISPLRRRRPSKHER